MIQAVPRSSKVQFKSEISIALEAVLVVESLHQQSNNRPTEDPSRNSKNRPIHDAVCCSTRARMANLAD